MDSLCALPSGRCDICRRTSLRWRVDSGPRPQLGAGRPLPTVRACCSRPSTSEACKDKRWARRAAVEPSTSCRQQPAQSWQPRAARRFLSGDIRATGLRRAQQRSLSPCQVVLRQAFSSPRQLAQRGRCTQRGRQWWSFARRGCWWPSHPNSRQLWPRRPHSAMHVACMCHSSSQNPSQALEHDACAHAGRARTRRAWQHGIWHRGVVAGKPAPVL